MPYMKGSSNVKRKVEEGLAEVLSEDEVFLIHLSMILPCSIEDLKITLTTKDIERIGKLSDQGLVYLKWNDEILHENFQELTFTMKGDLLVFKTKYSEEIKIFQEYLENNEYNCSDQLLDNFLITCNLSLRPEDILNIEKLERFSCVYDCHIK